MAMGSIGTLVIDAVLDVERVKQGMNQLKTDTDGLASRLSEFSGKAAMVGTGLTAAFTLPIAAIGAIGVSFKAMEEQAFNAFSTMLGSGEKAQVFLDNLKDFAAKTPFEFPDLVRASQRMMAMGFESEKVVPMLTAVGDAAAAMGGSSAMIDRVTTALGQMQAKQKVSAEEMMQLTEAGIPAWEMLAAKIGVDIPTAMDMASEGSINAGVAIEGLVEGMNAKFGGMMAQQATTFQGMLSTIKDTATFMIADALGPTFDKLKVVMQAVADVLPTIQTYIANLSPEVKNAAVAFGLVLAAAGPLALGIAGVTAAVALLISPIGIAAVAVGGFVAAMAAFPAFRGVVLDVLKAVIEGVVAFGSYMGSVAQAVMKILKADLKGAWETMKVSGTKALDDATWAADKFDSAIGFLGKTIDKVKPSIKTAGAVITKDFVAPVKQAKEKVKSLDDQLKELAKQNDTVAAAMKLQKTTYEAHNDVLRDIGRATINLKDIGTPSILTGADINVQKPSDANLEFVKLNDALMAIKKNQTEGIKADNDRLDNLKKKTSESSVAMKNATADIESAAGQIFNTMLTKGEFAFGSMISALKGGALSIGQAIFEDITGALMGPIKTAFDGFFGGLLESTGIKSLISGLSGKLSGAITGLFGGGGTTVAAGSVPGIPGIPGLGGAGGGATGAAGGLTTGLLGGIAGGVISGLGSFLGSMRLEGTMNAVEENTRYTQIQLKDTMEQILWPIKGYTEWMAGYEERWGAHILPGIEYHGNAIVTAINNLAAMLADSRSVTLNYSGGSSSGDAKAVHKAILDGIKHAGWEPYPA